MINKILDFIHRHICEHDYEEIESAVMYDYADIYHRCPIGERHTYFCKKCGSVKIIKTY